jgi:hypothetical protein
MSAMTIAVAVAVDTVASFELPLFIDFPSDQQVVAPILTVPRLAGRSEANCRITISVAFLPQKMRQRPPVRTEAVASVR